MEEEVKYCKNCKRDISAKNYVIHTVHCERKIQLCDRCSEPVPRSELEKHEEEFHSKYTCSECGISVEKWQVEKHKEICVKKLVPCEYCELEVPLDNLSEHSAACGSRTEQCSKCNKHVMLKDLEKHPRYCSREETCARKLVPCEYCELEVPLDILSEHSAACGSRTEQCSKCNKHVMIKDLEKHPINCSRREPEAVPCEHCGLQTHWNELMEHAAICGTRTERCFLCTELVMVKDRDTHFVTCGKGLNFNESISCDYCGGSFSNSSIGKHSELCRSRVEKCNECNNYIERKDMEFHLMMCKQKRLSRLEFPCQYCGELYSSVFLRDHSDICGTRTQKCEKCDKYIALKNMEIHSNVCEEKRQLKLKVSSPCKFCGKLFSSALLEDHVDICRSRNQKCEKCDKYIPLKNMEMHLNICKEKRQFRPEFPCKYCGESYLSDFLEDHVDKCGTRIRKCAKCDKYIALKNMETHSNVCKESMSKTHGDCPICHQSIPWMEMNIHCAYCTQVNSEIQEYEHQNKINELALRKESEALRNKISDKKKSQLDEGQKKCSFCSEVFPCYHFAQHLEVCQERPYNCNECLKHGFRAPGKSDTLLKAMSYRMKEEHEHSCLGRRTKTRVDDYMLQDEETDDNKELKKLKKCQFCDKRFPDVLFQHHLNECKHRQEKCTVCLENVPVKDMHDHRLLKCNFAHLAENKNFNNRNNTYAEAIPEPSKNFERMGYLEEIVEICPSCKCKIPEERYHEHLLLCYNGETRCHFCGIKIPKEKEHSHFRYCPKILEIMEEDNSSQSKKKKGKINKGKSFTETLGHLIPSWMTSNKEKSFERNSTRETYQESHSWQLNKGQNYERGNMTPVYPPTPRLNEVNELPCEFCNQMWPSELLIEHESGCRPDLVSFPKTNVGNEDDQKFAAASATVSQISHTPVLGASPKSIRKEDNEWKVLSRRSNQASIRESIDYRKNERNVPQKQVNAKEKFFFYSSQDTYDASKNQSGSFRKKRYPQMREGQEPSKTKPDKEIGVKKDDLKINQFTSFKFNTSRNDEESQNASDSRKENDDVLSTDVKNYDEIKKGNSYDLRTLSAESSPMVHYPKSDFNREIRAVGAERTERKRILNSRKDVDVNKDFEEISVLKSITFDENNKSEPSKFLDTMESRTFNLSMPAIWNTESTLSSDKTLRSPLLKSFDNNYDNEAKVEALSNAAENIDHRAFFSSTQETDYDVKNNETFGSNSVESINDNQNEENENDTRSERSNSDDTFYDADDGGAKYFDTVNDNFRGSSNTQEEKLSHYDFDNLNFSSRNQKENVNPSSHEDLNADIRLEEEDLNQKDCDLDGYFQFLHKSIKQSDEAVQRMIGEVEKLSYRTAGDCKCGNKECCCELSSLIQKTSPQACSFKDASCSKSHSEPMDIEPLVAESKTSNQMKSKKSEEFSNKKKVEDENIDEAMKWRKWRVSEKKLVFSSDSE